MNEQKYHIYMTDKERSAIIKSLISLKNNLISQGRYTDAVCCTINSLCSFHIYILLITKYCTQNDRSNVSGHFYSYCIDV